MDFEIPSCLTDQPALSGAYLAYQSNRQTLNESGLKVAACGVYNAGKSSLLNTLVDRFDAETEAFKTGDVRVTTEVSELKFNQLTLVDMPGVDGSSEDDETAWEGILRSDYFLYVHRIRAVEFEQSELDFLKRLKDEVDNIASRLVLVISQIDDVSSDEDASRNTATIRDTFIKAVGFEPEQTFSVSVTRYVKGMREGKQGLTTRSGIPPLKQWIDVISSPPAQAHWARLRTDRLNSQRDALAAQILALAEQVDSDIHKAMEKRQSRLRALEEDMRGLLQTIKGALARIDSLA